MDVALYFLFTLVTDYVTESKNSDLKILSALVFYLESRHLVVAF